MATTTTHYKHVHMRINYTCTHDLVSLNNRSPVFFPPQMNYQSAVQTADLTGGRPTRLRETGLKSVSIWHCRDLPAMNLL